MDDKELQERIKGCTFCISSGDCVIAFLDVPEGGFKIVAKGKNEDARKIVELANENSKLVVETAEAPEKFYNEFQVDEQFTKWGGFLIDIMEEFRLTKTGSKTI